MSHNSPVIKAKRKAISLDTKIKILDQLTTGQGATAVGKHFGIHEATIRTIKKNETAIRKSVCSGTKISAKSSSYIRYVVKEKMEKALVMWIEDKSQKRITVDGIAIKQTALRIYKRIKEVEPGTSSQSKQPEFSASTGWMTGFLKRHALHNVKIKGETASADELAAKKFPEKLRKIIEDGGYTPDQVWNVDESGLFWKKCPAELMLQNRRKLPVV
ncbi:tigger transposable element-derived protein 1-like [Anastrepha ludens]|uniref:tigger transposable element-derived protein 1-like n=1 Tax=Anastrepha ludens TaxID=28586 RepID=UPI0023B13012|nr:tigger transposable element-derived protein 1-like [Anastrepha ludens]